MAVITVRESLLLNGVWSALGALGNDTVVLREENDSTTYFWSDNGGKEFYLKNNAQGGQRVLLKTKWPAGGICPENRTLQDVKFFGQSRSQRECVELKRLLRQSQLIET